DRLELGDIARRSLGPDGRRKDDEVPLDVQRMDDPTVPRGPRVEGRFVRSWVSPDPERTLCALQAGRAVEAGRLHEVDPLGGSTAECDVAHGRVRAALGIQRIDETLDRAIEWLEGTFRATRVGVDVGRWTEGVSIRK